MFRKLTCLLNTEKQSIQGYLVQFKKVSQKEGEQAYDGCTHSQPMCSQHSTAPQVLLQPHNFFLGPYVMLSSLYSSYHLWHLKWPLLLP